MGRKNVTLEFATKALEQETDECINWPFSRTTDGYGFITTEEGERRRVNNWVCEQAHCPAPTENHVSAHSCRNPGCINKRHVSWKTHKGNWEDRRAHGWGSKLSDEAILQIKKSDEPQRTLAARYKVSQSLVSMIKNGKAHGGVQ